MIVERANLYNTSCCVYLANYRYVIKRAWEYYVGVDDQTYSINTLYSAETAINRRVVFPLGGTENVEIFMMCLILLFFGDRQLKYAKLKLLRNTSSQRRL